MEAPEKIYLQDSMSTDTVGELWPEWFDAKVSDYSIEYTRTDAFIDKAEKFLKSYRRETPDKTGYISGVVDDKMIEDFKTYMKRE